MTRPGDATLYELAVTNGAQSFLVMYTNRRSRRMLWDCCRKHAERLAALAGTDVLNFAKRSADGATIGAWTVRWTGRTQREAQSSKLPWIGEQEVTS